MERNKPKRNLQLEELAKWDSNITNEDGQWTLNFLNYLYDYCNMVFDACPIEYKLQNNGETYIWTSSEIEYQKFKDIIGAETIEKTEMDRYKNYEFILHEFIRTHWANEEQQQKGAKIILGHLTDIISEKTTQTLNDKLLKEGKVLDWANLIMLSYYFKYDITSKPFVVVNQPQNEIIEKINSLGALTKIRLEGKNGSAILGNKDILEALKQFVKLQMTQDNEAFVFEEVTTFGKIADKSIIAAYFVGMITDFLHKKFPGPRKKGSLISVSEQELVFLMLKTIGISNGFSTQDRSRYRQLLALKDKITFNPNLVAIPDFEGSNQLREINIISRKQLESLRRADWTSYDFDINPLKSGSKLQL